MIIALPKRSMIMKKRKFGIMLAPVSRRLPGTNQTFLFNGDQIERILPLEYQDEEQFEFKKKADSVIEQLRKKSAGQQEEQPQ